ncbi:MAG: autotransporter outer membrane beta-barrel domain-containing protein, partial [Desulfovibrio sp.]|nr:autotransporter outer membrane beta-barrel domain-containing protein [Desulfovibrio sp.]
TTPSANPPSVAGATVSLSNFAAGPALRAGDEFYLIDTGENGGPELAAGDPANNRARARQGLTREYEFIVDTNQTHDASALNSRRYLVARLASSGPAPEARILSEGRAASLAFLVHGASWLPDHSYQQADLALQADDAWTPFGGVDGAWLRADSGSDIDISATNIIAGAALKRTGDSASLLFGGFFDAGWASYNISGDFGSARQKYLDGEGNLRYYGLGLMSRLRWRKGFRLEGSLRAGFVENEFRSTDLADVDGKYADYDITVPYVALHAGAGYEWQVTEKSVIDILGRYYWTHQGGTSATLDTDEDITFRPDNSHRLRAGARYTYARDEDRYLSFYAGAAYEYEFDHKIHARNQDGHELDAPGMTGPTGIGEIGMIIRPRKDSNITLECGLQGYTGMRRGISGGIRLGLEF